MDFELITVSSSDMTQAQASEVIALCSDVFRLDYAYYMNLCPDRVHVLGYADRRLMSHALWLSRRLRAGAGPWLNAAYVEGVATHPDYRARGYGSALMRHLQQEISRFDLGALSPATARVDWYERLGWVRWQGPLFILKDGEILATPDDAVMVYRTPQSGTVDVSTALAGEWRPFEPW
ncbi:MAG: GNAT family N-acetyltransferase [Chloroflexi bacterium]|nr:GNAT family N-acetyltransferase [Chloroflexota bacterium]